MKRRSFSASRAGALAAALASELRVSPEAARALVENGAVYVRGRRARAVGHPLRAGDPVTVVLEESGRSALESAALPQLRVLAEDDRLIAVNKPAGVTTQPTAGRAGASLLDAVSAHLGRAAGLVHRLDRDTSGVVVFGKAKQATSELAAQFRDRTAKKEYLAVTGPGLPERQTIDLPLSRDPKRPGRYRATRAANGVPALTELERLHGGEFCIAVLRPETGRTHQLRAHLAAIGAPIVGDALYGGPPGPRCLLHAWRLTLGELAVTAPIPPDIEAFTRRAGLRLE